MLWEVNIAMGGYERGLLFGKEDEKELLLRE